MTPEERALLDQSFPPCGPCAFCGHPQARHRTTDAIRDQHRAGESAEEIARWMEYSEAAVRALVALSPQAYGAWVRSGKRGDR